MSLLFSLSVSKPAEAQQSTHPPFWAVLDFENDAKYGGSDIGREASDALALELGRSDRFNVINRSDVNAGLNALGLQQPLDSTDSIRLGKQINADAIVTGNILAITQKNNPSQADVIVAVKVTDSTTGELINGALAEGLSTPRNGPAPDFDTLVTEAVSKAAFAAVKQITSYNLPEPTILNNEGTNTVVLSMGARDGVKIGERFMVRRGGNEVGQIQVTTVEPDQAEASVTVDSLGIRPGDLCRAIYNLPSYEVRGGRVITDNGSITQGSAIEPAQKSAFSGVGGILIAIAAAAIIFGLVNHGASSDTIGGGVVGGVAAQAAYGPEIGLPFPPTLATDSGGTDLTEELPSVGDVITWSTGNLNPRAIVCFNIYRQDYFKFTSWAGTTASSTGSTTATTGSTGTTSTASTTSTSSTTSGGYFPYTFNQGPIISVTPSSREFIDTGSPKTGTTFEFVTSPGLSGSSGTTSGSTSSSSSSSTSTGGSSTTSGSTSSAGGGSSPPVLVGTIGTESLGETPSLPGINLGATTNYVVTAIYQVTDTLSGSTSGTTSGSTSGSTSSSTSGSTSGGGVGYEETAIQSGGSGSITPMIPVDATGGGSALTLNGVSMNQNSGFNLSSLNVSFQNQAGADTYIIDFATDTRFQHKVAVLCPVIPQSATADAFTVSANGINLKSLFPTGTFSGGTTKIYYRIGSRFSGDNPGPYRNDTYNPNPDTYSGGGTYMYSAESYFSGS